MGKARQNCFHTAGDLPEVFSWLREFTIWRPSGGFLGGVHALLDACRSGHSKVIVYVAGSCGKALWSSLDGRVHSGLPCRKDSILGIWISWTGRQDGSREQWLKKESCEDFGGHRLEGGKEKANKVKRTHFNAGQLAFSFLRAASWDRNGRMERIESEEK